MGWSFRIMADARRNPCVRQSKACRMFWKVLPAKFRSSWTAASGAARTFLRPWRLATAVGIGRPHAWGLAAFGQSGVEAILEILRRELRTIMRQAGTISVDKIKPNYIVVRSS